MTGNLDVFRQYLDWQTLERASQRLTQEDLEAELAAVQRRLTGVNVLRHPVQWYKLSLEAVQIETIRGGERQESRPDLALVAGAR